MKILWFYKRKVILTIIVFVNTSITIGQNLVPNPSFEEFGTCRPEIDYCYMSSFNGLKNWMSPNLGSPDYYNVCDTSYNYECYVPNNFPGYQYPHFGNGYVGLTPYNYQDNPYFHEYIEVKLTDSLKVNKKYNISLYISLSDSSCISIKDISIFLSDSLICYSTIDSELPLIPQISFDSTFYSDKVNWVKLSTIYTATSNINYLTIGNFKSRINTDTLNVGNCGTFYTVFSHSAYYYIDDASVTLCEDTIPPIKNVLNMPSAFTPNSDGKNDIYKVHGQNIKSMYGKIFNRWGQKLYEWHDINTGWDGKYKGNDVPPGAYFYVVSVAFEDGKIEEKHGSVEVIR